jgi:hypothetical protein
MSMELSGISICMGTPGTLMKMMINTSLMGMVLIHSILMLIMMNMDGELRENLGTIHLLIMDGTPILMDYTRLGNTLMTRETNGVGTVMAMDGTSARMESNTMIIHTMKTNITITLRLNFGLFGKMISNNGLKMNSMVRNKKK